MAEKYTIPLQHQRKCYGKVETFNGRAVIAFDMGLGKSHVSLLYAHRTPEARPIIVVCPAGLKINWEREAQMHFSMVADVLEGTKPQRGILALQKLIVINYDILGKWVSLLRELNPQLVILDEVHGIGDPNSNRCKDVYSLCEGVPHILGLTGTPFLNRPFELWPIIHLIAPHEFPSKFDFGMRYCQPKFINGRWEYKGAAHLSELHERLARSCLIRVSKEEVVEEMPEKKRIVLPIELVDRKEYDLALKGFTLWARGQDGKKAEKLNQLTILLQTAARLKLGFIYDWLDKWLVENDGKILLFGIHKVVIRALHERYEDISVVIDGSKSMRQRDQAQQAFQKDPRIRILVGNLKAAGVGLTLTAAHTVGMVELWWNPATMEQAVARCFGRLNDMHGVDVYYFVGKNTIEEILCSLTQRKQEIFDHAIDGKVGGKNFEIHDLLMKELLKDAPTKSRGIRRSLLLED